MGFFCLIFFSLNDSPSVSLLMDITITLYSFIFSWACFFYFRADFVSLNRIFELWVGCLHKTITFDI